MSGSIATKLEIDVMQVNELLEASELIVKFRLPAMVVHPGLAPDAFAARMRVRGRYKIIIPIDWPKGENTGHVKFRGVSKQALEADGFEIMITPNKSLLDTKNELIAMTDFIRGYLGEFVEVRFVLGDTVKTPDEIDIICNSLIGLRSPAVLRSDTILKVQQNVISSETHHAFANRVRGTGLQAPIKISGNMNNLKSIASAPQAHRYAVNVAQAKNILKEISQQPSELKEILSDA
jgi:hypothetical protein